MAARRAFHPPGAFHLFHLQANNLFKDRPPVNPAASNSILPLARSRKFGNLSLRPSAYSASLRYPSLFFSLLSSYYRTPRVRCVVHIPQRGRSHVFTHLPPRPKLPASPSCDFISASIPSGAHSHAHVSLPSLFFLSLKRNKPPKNLPTKNPKRRLYLRKWKTPLKSSFSKPIPASKPTATAVRKSTPACISTTNSASNNSPASTSITTVLSNPSKSRSSTSPTPAAAPPTSFQAPSPPTPIPPPPTPPPPPSSPSNPPASSASNPATSSHTPSSPQPRTYLYPLTSGATT